MLKLFVLQARLAYDRLLALARRQALDPKPVTGRQVADAAPEHRRGLKVLFITGYAENAATANGVLTSAMEMVTKPFAPDALAARIRDMDRRLTPLSFTHP